MFEVVRDIVKLTPNYLEALEGVLPDGEILERRAAALQQIPWPIPALVMLGFSDADLDALASATDADYWRTLNSIVHRIVEGGDRAEH